jgi:hypothetical protein
MPLTVPLNSRKATVIHSMQIHACPTQEITEGVPERVDRDWGRFGIFRTLQPNHSRARLARAIPCATGIALTSPILWEISETRVASSELMIVLSQ